MEWVSCYGLQAPKPCLGSVEMLWGPVAAGTPVWWSYGIHRVYAQIQQP